MPFLIVLDTFENVHNASEAQVRKIAGYIDALREHVPSLRVVVSGRNDVRSLLSGPERVEGLELTNLDVAAAHAVLEKLGVDAVADRAYIYGLTGGNPLSLHLAAELWLKGSLERGMATRVKYRASRLVSESLVQGMLYNRILFNIDDEDVKKLAHPGLALATSPRTSSTACSPARASSSCRRRVRRARRRSSGCSRRCSATRRWSSRTAPGCAIGPTCAAPCWPRSTTTSRLSCARSTAAPCDITRRTSRPIYAWRGLKRSTTGCG